MGSPPEGCALPLNITVIEPGPESTGNEKGPHVRGGTVGRVPALFDVIETQRDSGPLRALGGLPPRAARVAGQGVVRAEREPPRDDLGLLPSCRRSRVTLQGPAAHGRAGHSSRPLAGRKPQACSAARLPEWVAGRRQRPSLWVDTGQEAGEGGDPRRTRTLRVFPGTASGERRALSSRVLEETS